MFKKIKQLSRVFIKDYFENLYIFNKETKKINKKSIFTWLLLITIITISFLSYKVINWLNVRGQAILFLQLYLPIIATIFLFQTVLICSNVFYFSKDLEHILPLPIKPVELLIAKFNNVISIIYGMELLFLVMPLLIYGLIVAKRLIYFFTMILVLLIFPIFLVTIISLIMLFVMKLTKFIKNKDIFQIIIVLLISIIISIAIGAIINIVFNSDNTLNKIKNFFGFDLKSDKNIIRFAKEHGYEGAKYIGDWNEYKVYEPYIDEKNTSYSGLPLVILVNSNGEIRMSTSDEAFATLNDIAFMDSFEKNKND